MKTLHTTVWIYTIGILLGLLMGITPDNAMARNTKIKLNNQTVVINGKDVALSGEVETRHIEAPEYKGLVAKQGVQVILEERADIEIEADKELIDLVLVEVNPVGQVLEIGVKSNRSARKANGWNMTINDGRSFVTVRVPIHNGISSITGASAARISTQKGLAVKHLAIELSGAASLHAAIKSEHCTMDLSGASKAHIVGKFALCSMELHGASKVDLKGTAARLTGEVSGASKLDGDLTVEQIQLEMSGASKVELKGKTGSLRANVTSASKLDAEEMIASQANITASGASKAEVYCTGALNASTSGSSKIEYKGDCRVTKQGSVYKD